MEFDNEPSKQIKLCLVGNGPVGKTSIVQRFVSDTFDARGRATIGASYTSKSVIIDGEMIKYQIWDTAGHEKYREMVSKCYLTAAAAIVVYDIASKESFLNMKAWVRELKQCGPKNIILAVAGNKLDREEERKVSYDEGKFYADEINAIFMETSAKKGENIEDLFIAIGLFKKSQKSVAIHYKNSNKMHDDEEQQNSEDETDNEIKKQRFALEESSMWNKSTTSGWIRFKLHRVMDHIAARLFSFLLVLIDVALITVSLVTGKEPLAFQVVSLVIVSYFVLELILRCYAWGCEFFKHRMEIADMVIIIFVFITTVINEIVLTSEAKTRYETLIVVLRFLRIFLLVRLFTGGKHLEKSAKYLISQNKRRYQKDSYDLDLTYITDRVIAMSFPSSSGESVYRNPISEVSRFFNDKHPGLYKIYNLCSEKSYETHYFNDNVERIPIDDHNVPKLSQLLQFCHNAKEWLSADENRVIAVHCKGGKGRTGTCIASWLLFSRQFRTAQKSLYCFEYRRTDRAKGSRPQGVEMRSQRRYVRYVERVLRDYKGVVPAEKPLVFVSIKIKRIKNVGSGDGKDFKMEVIVNGAVKYTLDFSAPENAEIKHKQHRGGRIKATLNENARPVLRGDIKCKFYSSSRNVPEGYDNCAFFFWFHTSFIHHHKLQIQRDELDNPHKANTWRVFKDRFGVTLKFADPS